MNTEHPIESRLIQYIIDSGLHGGQSLPNESKLSESLHCSLAELNEAFLSLESRGLLKQEELKWYALNPEEHGKNDLYSLSKVALEHGNLLETKVFETALRLPLDDEEVWKKLEKRAQCLLGLKEDEPFIIITRFRKLSGTTVDAPEIAIHRAYLNPSRFPADFLSSHDFGQESLSHIYIQNDYQLLRRDTSLKARLANLYERIDFKKNGYDVSPFHAVLHAEQVLFAKDSVGTEFCLEFLQASYVNWTYTIKNRPMS